MSAKTQGGGEVGGGCIKIGIPNAPGRLVIIAEATVMLAVQQVGQ